MEAKYFIHIDLDGGMPLYGCVCIGSVSCVSRSEGTFAASVVLSEHHTTAQCLLLILNLRPCLYTYIFVRQ